MELARYFQMGGWPMYPLLLILMLALAGSVSLPIVAFVAGKPKLAFVFSMLLAILGLLAAGMGALGRAMGMRMVEQAVAHVNPADKETILTMGSGEARVCLAFGLFIAVLPLAAACVALGRAVSQKVSGLAVVGSLVLALGVAVMVGGLASRQVSLIEAETAFANADPSERATFVAFGQSAAARASTVSLVGGVPLALIGAALLVVGANKAKAANAA